MNSCWTRVSKSVITGEPSLFTRTLNAPNGVFQMPRTPLSSVYSQNSQGGDQKGACLWEMPQEKSSHFPHLKLERLVSEASGSHHHSLTQQWTSSRVVCRIQSLCNIVSLEFYKLYVDSAHPLTKISSCVWHEDVQGDHAAVSCSSCSLIASETALKEVMSHPLVVYV